MSDLFTKLNNDLVEAQKARDDARVSTLRMLISAVKYRVVELRPEGKELSDEDVIGVIAKQVKQRRESITEFEKGGRTDLVAKESKELEILSGYMPEQMNEDDLRKLIDDAFAKTGAKDVKDMGKVLGILVPQVKGKADMGVVSRLVKEKLSS